MTSVITVPKRKMWSCVACTFENLESNVSNCYICGIANPEAEKATKSNWSCRRCTFENSEALSVCIMCHSSKGWQCPKCPVWNNDNNSAVCEACGHSSITHSELVESPFIAAQQYKSTYPQSEHEDEEEVDIVGYEMPPTDCSKDGYSKLE